MLVRIKYVTIVATTRSAPSQRHSNELLLAQGIVGEKMHTYIHTYAHTCININHVVIRQLPPTTLNATRPPSL